MDRFAIFICESLEVGVGVFGRGSAMQGWREKEGWTV